MTDAEETIAVTLRTLREVRGAQPHLSVVDTLAEAGVSLLPTLASTTPHELLAATTSPEVSRYGRYELRSELGRGGMGRVIEAYDPDLRRTVALKLIVTSSRLTPAHLARFIAEAQLTSQLEHPSIIPVHDLGIATSGEVFYVMKRVSGTSMREVIDALGRGDEEARARAGGNTSSCAPS